MSPRRSLERSSKFGVGVAGRRRQAVIRVAHARDEMQTTAAAAAATTTTTTTTTESSLSETFAHADHQVAKALNRAENVSYDRSFCAQAAARLQLLHRLRVETAQKRSPSSSSPSPSPSCFDRESLWFGAAAKQRKSADANSLPPPPLASCYRRVDEHEDENEAVCPRCRQETATLTATSNRSDADEKRRALARSVWSSWLTKADPDVESERRKVK